jgi:hypothetical protein
MPLSVDMTESEILDHLEDICATEDFRKSVRCSGFLRYVVGETLAGRPERIKAYAIAVSALGRDETFDPQVDPVVRIEAGQLNSRRQSPRTLDINLSTEVGRRPWRFPAESWQAPDWL